MPGLADIPLDVHDVQAVPSAALTYQQVLDLVGAAGAAVAAGASGAVVTQGTDSLEETAFLADLVWAYAAPLVLTGAMRNPTLAGPDGPANLLAAARVAAAPAARDLGVLVAFGAAGSETDLLRRGLIGGGLLDPYQAKVLLRLLLAGGAGRAEIDAAFHRRG